MQCLRSCVIKGSQHSTAIIRGSGHHHVQRSFVAGDGDPDESESMTCYPSIFSRQRQPKSGSIRNFNAYDSKKIQNKIVKFSTSKNHQISVVVGKEDGEVYANEEVLLTIGTATVHLVDDEESVHLATGNFSLIRLNQKGNGIAAVAKVGEELQWPLGKDTPTSRIDKRRYIFTFKIPQELVQDGSKTDQISEALSYGVTFSAEAEDFHFNQLHAFLQDYNCLSASSMVRRDVHYPTVAVKQNAKAQEGLKKQHSGLDYLADCIVAHQNPPVKPDSLPYSTAPNNVGSAAYWTTLAPNVENYNGSLAKGVAAGSGQIIRGIFWCSETTVSQLEKGDLYLRERIKPNINPTQISPRTMRNIKRAREISKMTETVTIALLQGIITITDVTGTIINSTAGGKLLKMVPGEVALASLDAFAKVCDALGMAGKNLLTRTNEVTSGLVSYRYGEEAGAVAKEGLAAAGHLVNTAWTVSKISNALNPKETANNSKLELVKTAGKAVLTAAGSL